MVIEYIKKTWSDYIHSEPDKKITIMFEIPENYSLDGPPIQANILIEYGNPCTYPLEIHCHKKEYVSFIHNNELQLDGWFKCMMLHSVIGADNAGVFSNLRVGSAPDDWHSEGFMVTFKMNPAPAPPAPPVTPTDPGSPPLPLPEEKIRQAGDLFPYVYMRVWPSITKQDLKLNFVTYNPGPDPGGTLYATLVSIGKSAPHDPQARFKMKQCAVSFIDSNRFVNDPRSLPGPIGDYIQLYDYIRSIDVLDMAGIRENIQQILQLPEDEWNLVLSSPEYAQGLNAVWDSYFALTIILGYDREDYQGLVMTLAAANFFNAFANDPQFFEAPGKPLVFQEMAQASIILPNAVFPLPPGQIPLYSPDISGNDWIEPYAIGDLQMVRRHLLRYEPGEIAKIINIMPGERKELKKRRLNRTSEAVRTENGHGEVIENRSRENRTNLAVETLKTIAENKMVTHYDDDTQFTTTYGPPIQGALKGGWNVEIQPEKPSREDVSKFARTILNQTAGRITRRVLRERHYSALDETEETETSIFDNTGNANGLTGIYRWLNKVFKIQVVNYGARMMIEFMVETPAADFISRETEKQGGPFREPEDPGIHMPSFKAVTPDNYAFLASLYHVTDIQPPPPEKRIISELIEDTGEKRIALPDGYQAKQARVSCIFSGTSGIGAVKGIVGRQKFEFKPGDSVKKGDMFNECGTIPFGILGNPAMVSPPETPDNFMVSVEVECGISDRLLDEWKIKTYQAILDGYRNRKAAWRENAGISGKEAKASRPGRHYRDIERRELKKACFKLLFERYFKLVGYGYTSPQGAGQAPGEFIVNEPRYSEFFDRVFEWDEMACQFHEHPIQSHKKIDIDAILDRDLQFADFLRADTARIMVPARPENNMAVLYFLSSGMLWTGGNDMAPANESDVPVANELKKTGNRQPVEPGVCDSWEVVVPTAMTILQDSGNEFLALEIDSLQPK